MLTQSEVIVLIKTIIKHQQTIIGPLAVEQANKVPGVEIKEGSFEVIVQAKDGEAVLIQLVKKYEELFGKTSIEVCKDAVKELHANISLKDLPAILQ